MAKSCCAGDGDGRNGKPIRLLGPASSRADFLLAGWLARARFCADATPGRPRLRSSGPGIGPLSLMALRTITSAYFGKKTMRAAL